MKKISLLIIAMLALAGCPGNKGKSNNNGLINGYGYGGCVNCAFNPAPFSQSVTSEIPQASLTLTISGDANQMNGWAYGGQNPLFSYQGPMSVIGVLNVVSGLPFGMCQLPPGQYQVRTLQSGLYNIGTFQVPAVEFLGPVRLVAVLSEGTILTNGNGVITGFGAMIYGVQGPSMMGGYGYPQQNFNMMSNCADTIGVRF